MSTSRSSPHSNISCNLKEREKGGEKGGKGGGEERRVREGRGGKEGKERERGEGDSIKVNRSPFHAIIIYTGIYKKSKNPKNYKAIK